MVRDEKVKKGIQEKDLEEDVYTGEGQEELIEDDEIDELEEGFMEGYSEENLGECKTCKKVLRGPEETVELEIADEKYMFCSERCAEKFKAKHS